MKYIFYYLLIFIISCGQARGMLSPINLVDQDEKDRAFRFAIYENDYDQVQEIYNTGINVNKVNERGEGALFYSCGKDAKLEIAKFLIENGADVNQMSYDVNQISGTPLKMATFYVNEAIVKYLLSQGADPNISTKPLDDVYSYYGITENDEPVKEPKVPLLRRLLLVHNVGIEDVKEFINKDTIPSSSIRAIIFNKQEKISEFLKELTLEEINIKHENGLTLLHWAVGRANAPLVKELLKRGAHVLVKDDWGHTPLTLANRIGNREVRKLLLTPSLQTLYVANTRSTGTNGKDFVNLMKRYITHN